jgi:hypothetical protein
MNPYQVFFEKTQSDFAVFASEGNVVIRTEAASFSGNFFLALLFPFCLKEGS